MLFLAVKSRYNKYYMGKPSYSGHRSRLRKRFESAGLDSFLEHEILELLLTYCITRKDTKPLAWALLKKFGSLSGVLDATPSELEEVAGIGRQSTVFIKLIRAVMRTYFLEEIKKRKEITTPENDLTTRNAVIGVERLSVGTIDRASIAPRKIIEQALKRRAAALIFVHNHPSGEPEPSAEDRELTETLSQIASPLGIAVLDHIVVGKGKFFSMRANSFISAKKEQQ